MRQPIIAGNWKMCKTPAETTVFFEKFRSLAAGAYHCEILICPPYVDLPAAVEAAKDTPIRIGAQNLYWVKEGAFTGETSGPIIRAAGCTHVLIGHSERRQYFGETNQTVLQRTIAALEADLTPVVCVGERLEEREAGRTEAVLVDQFQNGIAPLTPEQFARIVIAYEPVWAIGTGKTATPEIAAEAHGIIRAQAAKQYGPKPAGRLRILYGGSVKPDNVKSLMAQAEIDGALVGGASLDPVSFAAIVNYL
jgi:triosephosphate isomerase